MNTFLENKYLTFKRHKRSTRRKASEGMTAAIILISFIITSAGIAFVILTMASEFQLELSNIGRQGNDAASTAVQVEGGIMSGYVSGTNTTISGFAFNLKLVLASGEVDLSSDAIEVWIIIGADEEMPCNHDQNVDSVVKAVNIAGVNSDYRYGIKWYDNTDSNEVLNPDEMARFFIGVPAGSGPAESERIVLSIYSEVATIKIMKHIPQGLDTGNNML